MTTVAEGLRRVRARIADAAARAGRDAAGVTLVGVTKGVPPERVADAVAAGLVDLGENRVSELRAKQAVADGPGVRWHLVGSLQRNKVSAVIGRIALVHSVDSLRLAEAIGGHAAAAGVIQDVLLQVNASGEKSKHGLDPGEARTVAGTVAAIRGVRLRGLMTIAAPGGGEAARPAFLLLRSLRDEIAGAVPGVWELSMGMSGDLEAAVEEGATIVRVGTAIFGPRDDG